MSKSAFTDGDIPNINYDSIFASHVATDKIKRYIPNSFTVSRTGRYLLNKDNLILGLEGIIGKGHDIVIIKSDLPIINHEDL